MEDPKAYVDEDLKELIPNFLANRETDLDDLKMLLEEGDLDGIEDIGHSLKGAGGGYGFDKISDLGWEIEKAAWTGDQERIKELIEELDKYMEEVEIIYE